MGEVWTWIISFLILITLLGLIVYQVRSDSHFGQKKKPKTVYFGSIDSSCLLYLNKLCLGLFDHCIELNLVFCVLSIINRL